MSRQGVDLVLALPMGASRAAKAAKAAQRSAWLRATHVPLRSIGFEASCLFDGSDVVKHRRTWHRLVASTATLAASQTTLEVLHFCSHSLGLGTLIHHAASSSIQSQRPSSNATARADCKAGAAIQSLSATHIRRR